MAFFNKPLVVLNDRDYVIKIEPNNFDNLENQSLIKVSLDLMRKFIPEGTELVYEITKSNFRGYVRPSEIKNGLKRIYINLINIINSSGLAKVIDVETGKSLSIDFDDKTFKHILKMTLSHEQKHIDVFGKLLSLNTKFAKFHDAFFVLDLATKVIDNKSKKGEVTGNQYIAIQNFFIFQRFLINVFLEGLSEFWERKLSMNKEFSADDQITEILNARRFADALNDYIILAIKGNKLLDENKLHKDSYKLGYITTLLIVLGNEKTNVGKMVKLINMKPQLHDFYDLAQDSIGRFNDLINVVNKIRNYNNLRSLDKLSEVLIGFDKKKSIISIKEIRSLLNVKMGKKATVDITHKIPGYKVVDDVLIID